MSEGSVVFDRALGRLQLLERRQQFVAIDHRPVVVLDVGELEVIDADVLGEREDVLDLAGGVAELLEDAGHRLVDDLDHAAADQLLVLDQGQVGLDASGVTVHHEADGAGGGKNGGLCVTHAVLFTVTYCCFP